MSVKDQFYESFGDLPSRRGPGGFYSYVKWQDVADRMNQIFGVTWSSETTSQEIIGENVIIRVRVLVRDPETKEYFFQEGFGGAPLGQGEPGNPFKSAYSKALKDACKKWGLALYKDDESAPASSTPTPQVPLPSNEPPAPAAPTQAPVTPVPEMPAAPVASPALPPNVPKIVQQEVTLEQAPPVVESTPPPEMVPPTPQPAPEAPPVAAPSVPQTPQAAPPSAAAVAPPEPQQPVVPEVPQAETRPAGVPLSPIERVKQAKQQAQVPPPTAAPAAPPAPELPPTPVEATPQTPDASPIPAIPSPNTGIANQNPGNGAAAPTEGQITGVQKVAIEGLIDMKGLEYNDVTTKALELPAGSAVPAIETLSHAQAISVIRYINDLYK